MLNLSFRRLTASLALISALSLPVIPALATDGTNGGYIDDSNPTTSVPSAPSVPVNPTNPPTPPQETPSHENNSILPQLDITERDHDPLVNLDDSENVGEFLKNQNLDQEQLNHGFEAARPLVAWTSWVVGWVLAIIVGTIALFNILGLAYIAIPIGFVRYLLSGGASNNPGGSANGGQGSMGSGFGAGGYSAHSSHGIGAPSSAMQGHSSGSVSFFRVAPSAAIQAVALAETGSLPGGQHNTNMNFNPGGANMNINAGAGAAKPVNPYTFFLKQQVVSIIALGISIVVLVLSSVLFDTGISLGNAFVQILQWLLSYLVG